MNFKELVLEEFNIFDPEIVVKIRKKTKSKIWKNIADVWINGKKFMVGTNLPWNEVHPFRGDYGSSIYNAFRFRWDKEDYDRLRAKVIKAIQKEYYMQDLSQPARETFGDLIDEL